MMVERSFVMRSAHTFGTTPAHGLPYAPLRSALELAKPTDNAYIETFNGSLREECLNLHWFETLGDARRLIEAWRSEPKTAQMTSPQCLHSGAFLEMGLQLTLCRFTCLATLITADCWLPNGCSTWLFALQSGEHQLTIH